MLLEEQFETYWYVVLKLTIYATGFSTDLFLVMNMITFLHARF